MAKYDDLTKEQKKLYNRLKTFVDRNNTFNFAIQYYKKEDLIEVFIIKNEVGLDGKALTLLEYADSTKKTSSAQTIREIMKSLKFPIDQHTSHPIQGEQQPLQSNLQDADPPASVSVGTGLEDNDNLTEDQQKLYDNLKSAIKYRDITNLLQNCNEEDLRRVLTVQQERISLDENSKDVVTLLGYALTFNNSSKKIEAILQKFKGTALLEVLRIKQEVTFSNGRKEVLTLLGYALSIDDNYENIEAILKSIDDYDLLKEVLTAKQIVDGKEYTLLQYADHYAPGYSTIIRTKVDEVEHTSQPTYFDQHKGKVAFGLGVIGVALVAFSFTVECGAASAFILGILAIAAAIGIAGKMGYDKVSERAEEYEISKCDAVKSIISDIFSISGKENNSQKI